PKLTNSTAMPCRAKMPSTSATGAAAVQIEVAFQASFSLRNGPAPAGAVACARVANGLSVAAPPNAAAPAARRRRRRLTPADGMRAASGQRALWSRSVTIWVSISPDDERPGQAARPRAAEPAATGVRLGN